MNNESLMAVTSEDGRYADITQLLAPYVSEFGLIRYRVLAETTYLLLLSEYEIIRSLSIEETRILADIHTNMTLDDAREIKFIESKTKHDVKAMIEWLKGKLKDNDMADLVEMVHYLLTSEDIDNVAYRLQLVNGSVKVIFPLLKEVMLSLAEISEKYASLPMLGRTHGQPAIPSSLGKEFSNFLSRIFGEYQKLLTCSLTGKLNGAIGNYNAHFFLEEKTDWIMFSEEYARRLGLRVNLYTTQVNPAEDIIDFLQVMQRINNILVDFSQDIWRYISDGWIVQKSAANEVGSSTMPHKVNPINFENAEGNLLLANSLINFFTDKLSKSRLQRDLSSSTVMRRIGSILAEILIGLTNIKSGLSKIFPNEVAMSECLNENLAILAEPVQLLLRRETDITDPYSLVKQLVRGNSLTREGYASWVSTLPIDEEVRQKLLTLSPDKYIGLAEKLAKTIVSEVRSALVV